LSIVEENEDYIVVDKPGDLVCHPTKDGPTSSLIGRLRLYLEGTTAEPRFVNRLDRETSGLVVVSKNRGYHKVLCRTMESARKVYWAVVEGCVGGLQGTVDQPLGKDQASAVIVKQGVRADGRPSRTHWRVVGRAGDATLLEISLETGRMHQIRVHMSWLGHPIVGDKLYGADETLYLELAEKSWTPRLRAALAAERQLLSALEIETEFHHWRIPAPRDLGGYRNWRGVRTKEEQEAETEEEEEEEARRDGAPGGQTFQPR
jgi:23S rRNA pseudouridine1911/1915/1917 synthase